MITDDNGVVQTQQQTQSTQEASQPDYIVDVHLWGFLIPCSSNLRRIDFQKIKPKYMIGRNAEQTKNDIILPGMKISNFHCAIEWDGDETIRSAVKVTDLSSNGTFINGDKIGKGHFKILRDGNEIAFGTCVPQPANGGLEDYRFVYRHLASGPPSRGLHRYYDLMHELGKGSFATVMKALHKEEGKWYAVKMIQANKLRKGLSNATLNGINSDDKSNNFAREINILERLTHPNICQLKEVFFERYSINLVLEWVPGGDLLDYILKHNGLHEREAQHLTYQMCDALAYVHGQGVAHRDLKPENVLLTDDQPPMVKVADFGLAKVVDSMTMLRTMCGTPVYLAPEVVNQAPNEGYDQVVDSWSVGVIVFSMLTMSTPFGEEDMSADVKTRVSTRQVEWGILQEFNVSPEGVDFIQKLLEYDPSKRMTLSDARHHPWLIRESELHRDTEYRRRTASPEPRLAIDASMRSIASDGMALDPQEGALMLAAPNGHDSSTPPLGSQDLQRGSQDSNGTASRSMLTRQPSRLQRRADVISHANEVGVALPGPSQEMQRRAIAEDEEEAGPPRANKRKVEFDASLTPMEEEDEESEVAAPLPRRARAAAAAGKKAARGGKKATATARVPIPRIPRKARANAEAAVESPAPRRSTRATTARDPSGPSPRKAATRRG
ncbi:Pkinase-domain-containing protein [Trametes versicolor FP-101664 SS1]|uniref:Pkinase-domain-containing protein n=1 Tax=Trametes versicolor (strain FP-101664) TaxID=717944 RepID=UPI0004621C56|nr:Pkinase-domain-containing protein [Trametes versicolor FP-101664 SS1]EIW63647.1 Pkinase-domain-containing protein [Trametes versicolor FP-101664 SS1]